MPGRVNTVNMIDRYYVYVHIDPRNLEEFYYGKGTGARSHAHLQDAGDSVKVARIKAIQKEGLEPLIRIIARGLTSEEALMVETALIWKLGRTLTNVASPGPASQGVQESWMRPRRDHSPGVGCGPRGRGATRWSRLTVLSRGNARAFKAICHWNKMACDLESSW